MVNAAAYGGDVALVSVTAPSLPWDRRNCSHAPGQPCSGVHGCRVHDRYAATWNRDAPRRWRSLHRAAAQVARRRCGKLTLVLRAWEYQRRGVLHMHVVLGMGSAAERAAAHVYVQALDELRQAHDFGYVDRGRMKQGRRHLELVPATRAARYLAKYLAPIAVVDGEGRGKLSLAETVVRPDVPPLVVYVSPKLTVQTGCTMRFLRWVRWAWVLGVDPLTGELVRPAESSGPAAILAGAVAARAP